MVAVFGALALMNVLTRDHLTATGWGLLALSIWLRGDRSASHPRWRTTLGKIAFAASLVVLALLAVQVFRRIAG